MNKFGRFVFFAFKLGGSFNLYFFGIGCHCEWVIKECVFRGLQFFFVWFLFFLSRNVCGLEISVRRRSSGSDSGRSLSLGSICWENVFFFYRPCVVVLIIQIPPTACFRDVFDSSTIQSVFIVIYGGWCGSMQRSVNTLLKSCILFGRRCDI